MDKTIYLDYEKGSWEPHQKFEGLYVKHFISGEENLGFKTYWVKVSPGYEIPVHTHDVTEVYLIYKGKGEVVVDGEAKILNEGTILASPAGVDHGMKNIGNDDLIVLANFTA